MIAGVDASHHQGAPDWGAVARAGYAFAILKATDRPPYRYVSWFHQQLPRVKAAGLIPGAYHFLRANGGADQAHYFIDQVNQAGGFDGMLAAVDVESNVDGTFPTFDTVMAFATEFKRFVPGHPLIVYTGHGFWVGNLGNPRGVGIGPLWHAEYEPNAAEVADGPELDSYGGWPGCTIWQYTSSGQVPGIGGCDVNQFHGGDRAALLALTGQQEDDMTPDQEAKLDRALASLARIENGGLNDEMRAAVDNRFKTVGSDTREELIDLLAATIGSPNHKLHQAVVAAVKEGAPPIDVAALATQVADQVLANLPVGSSVDPTVLAEALTTALTDVLPDVRLSVASG